MTRFVSALLVVFLQLTSGWDRPSNQGVTISRTKDALASGSTNAQSKLVLVIISAESRIQVAELKLQLLQPCFAWRWVLLVISSEIFIRVWTLKKLGSRFSRLSQRYRIDSAKLTARRGQLASFIRSLSQQIRGSIHVLRNVGSDGS